MSAAAVMLQVVSQLDSPEVGNGSSDGSAPLHSGAQQAELQLAAAWQVSLLCMCPVTLTALRLPCNSPLFALQDPPSPATFPLTLHEPSAPPPHPATFPLALQHPSPPCNSPPHPATALATLPQTFLAAHALLCTRCAPFGVYFPLGLAAVF